MVFSAEAEKCVLDAINVGYRSIDTAQAYANDVYDEIGEPKEGLEKAERYKEVIFWSFHRKDYQKTNWWSKTANASISNKLTIRTANTVKKIADM